MNCNTEIINKIKEKFIETFNKNWDEFLENLFFEQSQFSSGNHLRPQIVFMGYLATKPDFKLFPIEYDEISKLSISIEIIHKASLILDDLIDGDPARHGQKAFHIEYGVENTMMFAINLLSISIENFNRIISENSKYIILKEKGLNLLVKTMYDMSLGELKELNLTETQRFDIKEIQNIINLETSPLIANSLLYGYYAGNGNNIKVENIFYSIGYECGYIFQVMNDLEPFCQQEKIEKHKGRLNTDIIQNKKNIVFTLLYDLISKKERDVLNSITSPDEINHILISYFNKYKVQVTFFRELDLIYQNIQTEIKSLLVYGISKNWCELFKIFIYHIVNECKKRIS